MSALSFACPFYCAMCRHTFTIQVPTGLDPDDYAADAEPLCPECDSVEIFSRLEKSDPIKPGDEPC